MLKLLAASIAATVLGCGVDRSVETGPIVEVVGAHAFAAGLQGECVLVWRGEVGGYSSLSSVVEGDGRPLDHYISFSTEGMGADGDLAAKVVVVLDAPVTASLVTLEIVAGEALVPTRVAALCEVAS